MFQFRTIINTEAQSVGSYPSMNERAFSPKLTEHVVNVNHPSLVGKEEAFNELQIQAVKSGGLSFFRKRSHEEKEHISRARAQDMTITFEAGDKENLPLAKRTNAGPRPLEAIRRRQAAVIYSKVIAVETSSLRISAQATKENTRICENRMNRFDEKTKLGASTSAKAHQPIVKEILEDNPNACDGQGNYAKKRRFGPFRAPSKRELEGHNLC